MPRLEPSFTQEIHHNSVHHSTHRTKLETEFLDILVVAGREGSREDLLTVRRNGRALLLRGDSNVLRMYRGVKSGSNFSYEVYQTK